ncbi:Transcriptional repressor NF-X1 -like protein [Trichinella pseudospiralis]|uniref:Transcriptional repressor NF-X1-like protein n=1 Tax=Trichinella pseudospiralis TaxID=6337 RepID=A0A0V1IAA6_TRIPS|nr:Transcriptional repressor NF-X1 -like protein [Trichinella pseudospiralis]
MPNSLLKKCSRVTSNADFALPKFLKDALFYSNAHEQRKAETFISPDIVASYMKNEEQSCLICLKAFTEEQGIWSCKVCPCLIHGNCVERWAAVNRDFDGTWCCPGCRKSYSCWPSKKCYCGKATRMQNENIECFSCDMKCGKRLLPQKLSTYWKCQHVCQRICHPGPCDRCMSFAAAPCYCGRLMKMGNCSDLIDDRSCDLRYCKRDGRFQDKFSLSNFTGYGIHYFIGSS